MDNMNKGQGFEDFEDIEDLTEIEDTSDTHSSSTSMDEPMLDLFGFIDTGSSIVSINKNKKSKSDKASTSDTSNNEAKKDKPSDALINLPTMIRYAQMNFEITADHMAGKDKVSLEALRAYMENEGYVELGKERTRMEYDKDKNIVFPILIASRKG